MTSNVEPLLEALLESGDIGAVLVEFGAIQVLLRLTRLQRRKHHVPFSGTLALHYVIIFEHFHSRQKLSNARGHRLHLLYCGRIGEEGVRGEAGDRRTSGAPTL